ncbi:hypothetical protein GGI02_000775 [Coemansia sp. RSA 2322]|nr:hypothetical protein GGI02_000775 [Coemansia sp. RSA 2322]
MPYQGPFPPAYGRGGSNSRFNPYDRPPGSDRRFSEMQQSRYEESDYDAGSVGGRYGSRAESYGSRPPSAAHQHASRVYYDRDADAGGGHYDDHSYDDRYEDDRFEHSYNIRGRGGGRGRGGHDFGRYSHDESLDEEPFYDHHLEQHHHGTADRSNSRSDDYYGSGRTAARPVDLGYNSRGSNWGEGYVPAIQDDVHATYSTQESRIDPGYATYRRSAEHGTKRGEYSSAAQESDGFRKPYRSSYDNEPSSYGGDVAPRRIQAVESALQASGGHDGSRSSGHTDEPGGFKSDIPKVPNRINLRRTAFVRVPYNAYGITGVEIRNRLAEFGEVVDTLDLIPKNSVCYVMFYDSRAAAKAIAELQDDFCINGERLKVFESRHRPDSLNRSPRISDYQGTILVTLVGAKRGFEESDRAHFERFGEVGRFFPYYSSPSEWVVEYYDCRAARDAAMDCHGQPACQGTMYTTFLWDDSVPYLDLRPMSKEKAPAEATSLRNSNAIGREAADSPPAGNKSAKRSHGSFDEMHVDEPYRLLKREKMPEAQQNARPQPAQASASGSGGSDYLTDVVPRAKKRDSASKWMESTPAEGASSGGHKAAADQATTEKPTSDANVAASKLSSTISRLAQDPSVMKKAHAVHEMLQKHQSMLGIQLPSAMSKPSAPGSLAGSKPLRYDSQSTIVGEISPLIPTKSVPESLNGLLAATSPSISALNESADVAAGKAQAVLAAPVSMPPISSTAFNERQPHTPTTAVNAVLPTVSKQAQISQEIKAEMPSSSSHVDGINHLLGILAQVQKSAAAAAATEPKKQAGN